MWYGGLKGCFFSCSRKIKIEGKNKGFLASWTALVLGFTISCILVCLAAKMEKSQGERAVQATFWMQI